MVQIKLIDSRIHPDAARRVYDLIAPIYDLMVTPFEAKPRRRALGLADLRPGERVLEVATGTGTALRDILRQVGGEGFVCGVELSPNMVGRARRKVARAGFADTDIIQADARALPFADASFDLLFNSYMLDLIPLADMNDLLEEFYRVLRPDGRLVLLNLTKEGQTSLWERLYRIAPTWVVSFLLGGCRPVRMASLLTSVGFVDVRREYVRHLLPSEVVVARTGS